uniref:Uncharacterized protein n=1 Tax=Aegilops tauschii TaxID=37682 RepID=M8B178_AEGTA
MSGERKQLDLRAKVTKMVVEIHGAYPDPTLEDSDKKKYNSMVGTIVLATPHFCFGVLRRSLIQEDGIYTIKCDGQSIEIKAEDFVSSHHGFFAGFYIYHNKLPYDIKNVAAVEFGEEVKLFDVVNLCDITVGRYKMFIDITDGHVIHSRSFLVVVRESAGIAEASAAATDMGPYPDLLCVLSFVGHCH